MAAKVLTFGCRLNALESQIMRQQADRAGLREAVLVNTCAVTAEAVRQARQAIRRAARDEPGRPVIVTGCAAQIDPESFAAMPEVARVVGNIEKLAPDAYRAIDFGVEGEEKVQVNDIMAVTETAPHMIDGIEGRVRAFVQVQTGCDHRCTFCVIPYGRGNSRSVPTGAVVEQARRLVDNGYRELVLTGVDITSWGQDLPGSPRLGHLVESVLDHVPDLPRLRLSSIDSIEVDDRLFAAIAGDERIMPHLHLSLQAGHDLILKRMKRRHNRSQAIAFCEQVRQARPDIVIGADLIAGFPTETEEMFAKTESLVEDCGLAYLHVFPFSPRPGTPAARMPQLDRLVIKDRARRLRELAARAKREALAAMVGSVQPVLVEKPGYGRTPHYAGVNFGGGIPGTILDVTLQVQTGEDLRGRAVRSAIAKRQSTPAHVN